MLSTISMGCGVCIIDIVIHQIHNVCMPVDEGLLYRAVGARLRERRVALGMTQAELAQASGILRTSITNIEAGRQKAPLHVLYSICSALNVVTAAILPANADVLPLTEVTYSFNSLDADVPPKTAELLKQLLEE
jgi:transcriptional regulator with XRE-family HTH domain